MAAKKRAKAEPVADAPVKRGRGAVTTFTDVAAAEICERLSNGEPLASICRDDHMPAVRTVSHWTDANPQFKAEVAQARDEGFSALAAECLEIADTPLAGVTKCEKEWGTEIKTEDMLGHRKLQIETRMKLLACWDPKRYGAKVDANVQHSGTIEIVIGGASEE